MRRLINGQWVEVPTRPDNVYNTEEIRRIAQIPSDRALLLQSPSGENILLARNQNFYFPENWGITDVPIHKRGQRAPSPYLIQDLEELSYACPIDIAQDYSYIIVHNVNLPFGYNFGKISIWIDIPPDYPLSPPGVGDYKIYLPRGLRYQGRRLKDFYEFIHPKGDERWGWFCYQQIKWDPNWDTLVTLLEMIRADLYQPRT